MSAKEPNLDARQQENCSQNRTSLLLQGKHRYGFCLPLNMLWIKYLTTTTHSNQILVICSSRSTLSPFPLGSLPQEADLPDSINKPMTHMDSHWMDQEGYWEKTGEKKDRVYDDYSFRSLPLLVGCLRMAVFLQTTCPAQFFLPLYSSRIFIFHSLGTGLEGIPTAVGPGFLLHSLTSPTHCTDLYQQCLYKQSVFCFLLRCKLTKTIFAFLLLKTCFIATPEKSEFSPSACSISALSYT